MTYEEIEQRLTSIFREVLDDPSITLHGEMTAEDVSGWDSVNHIMIAVAVESRFRIRFQTSEIQGLRNVGELIELISQKGGR